MSDTDCSCSTDATQGYDNDLPCSVGACTSKRKRSTGNRKKQTAGCIADAVVARSPEAYKAHIVSTLLRGIHPVRSFTGLSFERANDEHRLYRHNSTRCESSGVDRTSVESHHLPRRWPCVYAMPPMQWWFLQCPLCNHTPFTNVEAAEDHRQEQHGAEA